MEISNVLLKHLRNIYPEKVFKCRDYFDHYNIYLYYSETSVAGRVCRIDTSDKVYVAGDLLSPNWDLDEFILKASIKIERLLLIES